MISDLHLFLRHGRDEDSLPLWKSLVLSNNRICKYVSGMTCAEEVVDKARHKWIDIFLHHSSLVCFQQ